MDVRRIHQIRTRASSALLACFLGVLPSASVAAPQGEPVDRLDWFQGAYMSALGTARHEGQMVCLYFWSGGSQNCQRMYQETLCAEPTSQLLSDFVCYSADASDANGARLLARYKVSTVPTVLLLSPEGEAQDAIIGFAGPQTFASEVNRIRRGEETVGTLRKLCADAPTDLSLRLRLSVKLGVVGALDERAEVLDSIRRDDPRGETLVGARLAFWDVRDPLQQELASSEDPTDVDLRAMYRHAKSIRHPQVRFEAREWIADAESARGDRKAAREALLLAWNDVPSCQ